MLNSVKRDEKMHTLYENAYLRLLERYRSDPSIDVRATMKKLLFLGIKKMVSSPARESFSRQEAEYNFAEIDLILSGLGALTPDEFMNLFPVDKRYDGEKWGIKDYFYTMDYIRKLPKNVPIGENIQDFLWEYINPDISLFMVNFMCSMSNLRRLDGQPGLAEEWAAENNITTSTLYKDSHGREFLIDSIGKVLKIKPARHLHAVK